MVNPQIEVLWLGKQHQVLQGPDAVVAVNPVREERRTVGAHRLTSTHPLDQATRPGP